MPQAELFIFFGLIASGKSTAAQAWAEKNDLCYHNSDVVRKELAGLAPTRSQVEEVDQGIYSRAFTEKTYQALLALAEQDIGRGRGVVLDASYQRRRDRDMVRALAARMKTGFHFILCVCPEDEMKRRMEERALDPKAVSDGRWEIYLKQKEAFEPPIELDAGQLLTVSTAMPVEAVVQQITTLLEVQA